MLKLWEGRNLLVLLLLLLHEQMLLHHLLLHVDLLLLRHALTYARLKLMPLHLHGILLIH